MTATITTILNNTAEERYELCQNGILAGYAEYKLQPGEITLTHTEVLKEFEGQGVASKLATTVLKDARKRDLKVVPECPFMAGYIRKHPEYQDLVAGAGIKS
jgi:predicted GNAT family acetyltransferase